MRVHHGNDVEADDGHLHPSSSACLLREESKCRPRFAGTFGHGLVANGDITDGHAQTGSVVYEN